MLSLVKFKVVANETKNFFSSWNFGCRIASETSYLEILIAKLPLKPAEFPREILAARFSLKFEICYLI